MGRKLKRAKIGVKGMAHLIKPSAIFREKKGIAEAFIGKLILFLIFIVVCMIIYAMISGKLSSLGGGYEWISG